MNWIILSDITERKDAEEERKHLQAQLLQAHKVEAIGTLAGGIAHDFNNILSAILGYAELARDAIPLGSKVANDLEEVMGAAHRAVSLIKQILAFSRQSARERILLKPACLLQEALSFLRPTLPATIAIRQHIDADTRSIFADTAQVHQIIMNLCVNAFHAMEQTGGTLDVTLVAHRFVPIENIDADNRLCIFRMELRVIQGGHRL